MSILNSGSMVDSWVGSHSDLCSGSDSEADSTSKTDSHYVVDFDSGFAIEEFFLPSTSRSTVDTSQ